MCSRVPFVLLSIISKQSASLHQEFVTSRLSWCDTDTGAESESDGKGLLKQPLCVAHTQQEC